MYGGPEAHFGHPHFGPPSHRISPVYCPDETDTVSTAADDSTVLHKNYKRAWDNLKVDLQDENSDSSSQRREFPEGDGHNAGFRRPKGAWTYSPVTRPDC